MTIERFEIAIGAAVICLVACSSPPPTPAPTPAPSQSTTSAQQYGPYLVRNHHLIVGVKPDQPQDSFQEGSQFSGYQIQLAKRIAEDAQASISFSPVVTKDRDSRLRNPSGDQGVEMVVADYSDTPAHEKAVEMGGPYMQTPQAFLARRSDPPMRGLAAFSGKTVCTTTTSTSLDALTKVGVNVAVQTQDHFGDCVKLLKTGQVDAVSTDLLILYGFQHSDPTLVVATDNTGRPVEVPTTELNNWMVGFPPGDSQDCDKAVGVIRTYLQRGEWERDFQTFFPEATVAYPDWGSRFKPNPASVHCT